MKKLPKEEQEKLYKAIKAKRHIAKTTNFSATYGAGAAKIADTAGIPFQEGKFLHEIYWKRNWAVKQTAKDCQVVVVNRQKWLYNSLSGFWMFLKEEKDRFSTLNQSSGVYVFDAWLKNCKSLVEPLGAKILLQYHDEILLICKKDQVQTISNLLHKAMEEVNKKVNLNVKISISIDVGTNYYECH